MALEEKRKTKVFAGNAVIGGQSTTFTWKTADPVTGTVANLSYSSEYGTMFSKAETEPLGQTLNQSDPADPPEPPANDSGINRADDPHWQCTAGAQFYGGFTGMPFHCQLKALLNAGAKLPWEEASPNHQPSSAPGREHQTNYARQDEMPVNPTSTEKPPAETAVGNIIPAAYEPDSDNAGDILGRVEVKGNFDSDRQIDFSETSVIEASDLGEQQIFWDKLNLFLDRNPECLNVFNSLFLITIPPISPDLDGISENTNIWTFNFSFVDTGKHPELLDKTLKELGANTLPEELLNRTLGSLFYFKTQDFSTGKEVIYEGAIAATIWDTGVIYFRPNRDNVKQDLGLAAFHEIFHAYFKGNHVKILEKLGLTVPLTNNKPDDLKASRQLDAWLERGCK